MNQNNPFFSCIIPTKDRPTQLVQAVNSVLRQTYKNFELLVIDDNSKEPAKAILSNYNDPRLIIKKNNRLSGANGARNTGIFTARGKWIAFLDDDDIWLPERLHKSYNKIRKIENSCVFIYTGFRIHDSNNKIISEHFPHLRGEISRQVLYKNDIGGFSVAIARRKAVLEIGGTDEKFPALQDKDFFYSLACKGKFDFIPEILIEMNSSANRISANYQDKLSGALLFFDKHRKTIRKNTRLWCRSKSVIFKFAFISHKWKYVIRNVPAMLIGFFVDPKNIFRTLFHCVFVHK